jgi:polar amino acid transport system ATP-binding protein
MSFIDVVDVRKRYRTVDVLDGVSLSVDRHEVGCLIGPSGCGKSTLLRCINGLEAIQGGEIHVGPVTVSEELADLNAVRRRVGIVFQQFNLFPHMNAIDNVSLGPRRVLRMPRGEAEERAQQLLERVGLGGKSKRYPDALSGGEQQRVAIARALAMRPDALLLDEITSALDPELVGEVLEIVSELAHEGMTMILATHEMGFAREVATRVYFLSEGRVHESGPPDKLFSEPEQPKTQTFLRRLMEARRI